MWLAFGATLIIMLLVFALMGVKVILKPGSEFKKTCSMEAAGSACSHCGRPAGEYCDEHPKQH